MPDISDSGASPDGSPRRVDVRDVGAAILAAVVGIALLRGASRFPSDAAMFPRLVGMLLLMAVGAVVLSSVVVAIRASREPGVASTGDKPVLPRSSELLHVLLISGYVIAVLATGFRIATLAYLVLMQFLLGYRRWLRGILIAVALVLVVDWFFFSQMNIRALEGWLFA